jgi:hypothetical protein
MAKSMGQQFVVENRPGAAGNLGAEYVARSAANGYTLFAAASSRAASQTLYKHLPFNLERDFAPAAMMASVPFLLVVNPSVPVRNVRELIEFAKGHPNELTFASTGNGSSPHLTMEMFMTEAHVSMQHVPYKGTGPAHRLTFGTSKEHVREHAVRLAVGESGAPEGPGGVERGAKPGGAGVSDRRVTRSIWLRIRNLVCAACAEGHAGRNPGTLKCRNR